MENEEKKPEDKRYPYAVALPIAEAVLKLLEPHCERIEIAGSIRRKKAMVGDIEIVAIPKPYQTGLFESGIAKVVNKWEKVRGNLTGDLFANRYTQRILPEGIKLDLFLTEPDRWGLIFAMRTGSNLYSSKVLASGWVREGYKSVDGYLTKDDEVYEVREEKDLFRLIGVPYVEPEEREL